MLLLIDANLTVLSTERVLWSHNVILGLPLQFMLEGHNFMQHVDSVDARDMHKS